MGPVVLSIETCTLAGSLSLTRGADLLGASRGNAGSSHSNTLLKEIDSLLSSAATQLRDVDLFAVAVGPGSFTGLRIGVATVKALAVTLNKPTAGISTLEAIALSAGESELTVALLPAGRGEVFTQLCSVRERVVTPLDHAAHLSPARMLERYSSLKDVLWAGPGAHAQQSALEEQAELLSLELSSSGATTEGWRLAPESENLAIYCGELALQRYRLGQLERPDELRAVYVRPSDAELKK